jgi:predicted transglutaminase-like cysteine proteinase
MPTTAGLKKGLRWLLWFCVPLALAEGLVINEQLLDRVQSGYGTQARARVVAWKELMETGRNQSDREKLERVNRFFNDMRFVDDSIHWGKKDYWATPVEFLASNGGDCEDFSLAKYFTLRELGVPVDRLRLTYAKAVKLNQAHMVLTYFEKPSSEPLVLDNLVDDIRPASRRKDLVPVYSFNGDGLWLAKERGSGRRVGESSRLGLWKDLNRRMSGAELAVNRNR